MNEKFDSLKSKLLQSIDELNKDASENWEDYKMIELFSFKSVDSFFQLELSVGHFEKSFFTVNVGNDFWEITDKFISNNKAGQVLETFIHYTVLPLLKN